MNTPLQSSVAGATADSFPHKGGSGQRFEIALRSATGEIMKISMAIAAGALAASVCGGVIMGDAIASQPYMENALTALSRARANLVAARPDKGGHRVAAIRAVDVAIRETKAGMAAAGY